jgi:salicylate hydroxylase
VQRAAGRQGRIYHMTGPAAAARDFVIQALGPKRMLAWQDWIFDWRV